MLRTCARPDQRIRQNAWVRKAEKAAREVAFELLISALLEIRAATEPGRTDAEAERRFANVLAHLAHNWPIQLKDMTQDDDYESLLRRWWDERDRRSDPWLLERMEFLGWHPEH